jgi:hypothetical protein
MPTDTIKWIEINLKVLDTINDNISIIGSTEGILCRFFIFRDHCKAIGKIVGVDYLIQCSRIVQRPAVAGDVTRKEVNTPLRNLLLCIRSNQVFKNTSQEHVCSSWLEQEALIVCHLNIQIRTRHQK